MSSFVAITLSKKCQNQHFYVYRCLFLANISLFLKNYEYLCSKIKNKINGKKTFKPPKGGFSREEHDK